MNFQQSVALVAYYRIVLFVLYLWHHEKGTWRSTLLTFVLEGNACLLHSCASISSIPKASTCRIMCLCSTPMRDLIVYEHQPCKKSATVGYLLWDSFWHVQVGYCFWWACDYPVGNFLSTLRKDSCFYCFKTCRFWSSKIRCTRNCKIDTQGSCRVSLDLS